MALRNSDPQLLRRGCTDPHCELTAVGCPRCDAAYNKILAGGPQSEQSKRSKRDRIERLRVRLQKQADENYPTQRGIISVIKGILDLLEDEL